MTIRNFQIGRNKSDLFRIYCAIFIFSSLAWVERISRVIIDMNEAVIVIFIIIIFSSVSNVALELLDASLCISRVTQ